MADKSKVISWLNTVVGKPAFDMGGAKGTQCVELCGKYVSSFFGGKKTGNGNGNKFASNICKSLPKQFELIPYTHNIEPKVGDIISYESGSSPSNGHVAICIVGGNPYKIAEQWAGSKTVKSNVKLVKKGEKGVSYSIINIARPVWTEPKASTFQIVTTAVSGLRVRQSPDGKVCQVKDKKGKLVNLVIPFGTKKTIEAVKGNWYKTKGHDHWINSDYCKRV